VAAVSWWEWVLIWILLVSGACAVMFVVLRQLWRKLSLLLRELGTAAERLSAISEELERLQDSLPTTPDGAAVFDDPAALRRERFTARTKHRRSQRRTRT